MDVFSFSAQIRVISIANAIITDLIFFLGCTTLYMFQNIINPFVLNPDSGWLHLDICLAATALGSK